MTSKRQMGDKKREDRALALLSLAAERPEPPGSCPAEIDLARLVEGRVTAEERRRLQRHLSLCHDCCRQWLAVARAVGRPADRGRLVRPGRFRRAGYLGTALALAASVAVFLNIHHEAELGPPGEPAGQVRLRETGEAAPKSEAGAPATAEPQPTGTDSARPAAPAKRALPAAPSPPDVQGLTGGLDEMARRQDKMADRELDAPAAPAESATKTKAALPLSVDDAGHWLDRVREGCRSSRSDPAFWRDLQAEGEGLHRQLQSQGNIDTRLTTMAAILPLLAPLTDARLDAGRLAGHCRLLQDEIGNDAPGGGDPR